MRCTTLCALFFCTLASHKNDCFKEKIQIKQITQKEPPAAQNEHNRILYGMIGAGTLLVVYTIYYLFKKPPTPPPPSAPAHQQLLRPTAVAEKKGEPTINPLERILSELDRYYDRETEDLNLARLEITTLGKDFFLKISQKFPAIKKLHLEENPIQELPTRIGLLRHLRYLNVSHTRLKSLPIGIGLLRNLEALGTSHSSLHELSGPSFALLTKLKRFYLRGTRVESLPQELDLIKNLETLDVRETPLVQNRTFWMDRRAKLEAAIPTLTVLDGDTVDEC